MGLPALGAAGYLGTRDPSNPYYRGPVSANFDGLRFHVGAQTPADKTTSDMLAWRFGGEPRADWPDRVPGFRDRPPTRVEGADLRVSYVGHASFLLQTHGVNLLIDPVWSPRASPVSFAGPLRVNDPGIAMEDLPPLDAILVSHNHYDHMDVGTLSALTVRKPVRVLTPLGNDAIIREHDAAIRTETFDWGARVQVGPGVFVHFEPAYHWSARGVFDRRMALWCAFVIETPSGSIYHVADTGFADGALFHEMKARHPNIRLAILPIGAYTPRWFMKASHIDPEEAVRIFQICGARQALAHHWGTFQLGDEAIDEPPRLLGEALDRAGLGRDLFGLRRPGEVLTVPALV